MVFSYLWKCEAVSFALSAHFLLKKYFLVHILQTEATKAHSQRYTATAHTK
jgi:hypothetical protein